MVTQQFMLLFWKPRFDQKNQKKGFDLQRANKYRHWNSVYTPKNLSLLLVKAMTFEPTLNEKEDTSISDLR